MTEHECRLYATTFTNKDLKTTVLIASTPNAIKNKAPEIMQGLVERGLVQPGNWSMGHFEEIYAFVPTENTSGFIVHAPEATAVGSR